MALTYKQEMVIQRVKNLIDNRPLERQPIVQLMEMSGLTEYKLTTGFKKLYGETIYSYQLRNAMNVAANLLKQGELIKSVGIAAGYKTTGNFARAFLKVFKCTPAQYQNGKIML